jgi:hypothetical protein
VRRTRRRIGYEESADVHAVVPIATLPASPRVRSISMRAIKLIRATAAAALLAGATFSAACAVEDEAESDDIVEVIGADEADEAAVKGDETAAKAAPSSVNETVIGPRCVGTSSRYELFATSTPSSGVTYTHYTRLGTSGAWTNVGTGVSKIINAGGSTRQFYAKGCVGTACRNSTVETRHSSCNTGGGGGGGGGDIGGDDRAEP